MSILRVDNIRDNGSGFNDVVSFQNVNGTENGKLCRAFVNFDGTGTVSIRANFNVNSITDRGTGEYTVNFTNSMSDANYAVGATHDEMNVAISCTRVHSLTSSDYQVTTTRGGPTVIDPTNVMFSVFR